MRIFILCILFYGSVFSKNFILSEPRSGVNLTCCSLIQILRRPVGGQNMKKHPWTNGRTDVPLDSNNCFVYRQHFPSVIKRYINRNKDKLIVLTRNPKELFMKFNPGFKSFSLLEKDQILKYKKEFFGEYIGRLQYYDKYPSDRKLLLFYEDIIDDVDATLLKILDFLELEPKYYKEYLENKEKTISTIRESYVMQNRNFGAEFGQSSKGGAKGIFYTKDVDEKILKEIDIVLMRMSPSIYNKYLKRFE